MADTFAGLGTLIAYVVQFVLGVMLIAAVLKLFTIAALLKEILTALQVADKRRAIEHKQLMQGSSEQ